MSETKKYLCFDIGGTNVKYGVLATTGEFIAKGSYRTERHNLNMFMDNMVSVIRKYQTETELEGLGISMPGFVDPSTGYVELAGAIRALDGQSLKLLLKNQFDFPIEVENDGNCAALAEKHSGNAAECSDFVCMTIGTGIGGGIFVNDKIVNGHASQGGEIGYMLLGGKERGYLNLHDSASLRALISAYKKHKGIRDAAEIKGEEVFEEAAMDTGVQQIIDVWYERLSYGIFNLAAVLNPEKVLIGGAVSVRDEVVEGLKKKLKQNPVWQEIAVEIEPCKHQNDAGMLGALYKLTH